MRIFRTELALIRRLVCSDGIVVDPLEVRETWARHGRQKEDLSLVRRCFFILSKIVHINPGGVKIDWSHRAARPIIADQGRVVDRGTLFERVGKDCQHGAQIEAFQDDLDGVEWLVVNSLGSALCVFCCCGIPLMHVRVEVVDESFDSDVGRHSIGPCILRIVGVNMGDEELRH